MTGTTTEAVVGDTAHLDVRPLAGNIGAEIRGVDLKEPLPDGAVEQIRAAWLRWKVVFFRNQPLTKDEHVAFGRRLGTVTAQGHPTVPPAFPDHPEIHLLEHLPGTHEALNRENRWHTDVTFLTEPAMATILHGVVVPPYGGDTQWTNLALAYERLSPPLRTLVDGIHAVHTNMLPQMRGETSAQAKSIAPVELRTVHPVVRVHPETGERVLFVNPGFTSHIVELTRRESDHLLGLLFDHIIRPEFTVRFHWEPHSIAMWDNRATAHLVPSDVPPAFRRSMERITLAGDLPVGVDGAVSYALTG